jgi:hypothetical protein
MRFISTFIFMFLIAAVPAQAEIAVVSGGRVKLTAAGFFDPVCHSLGPLTVGVSLQPHAGSILVNHGLDYPSFSVFNTRSRCNTLRLPMTLVSYQASAGYVGTDETALEIVGPTGRIIRLRYVISVRPAATMPPGDPPLASFYRPRHPHHYVSRAHALAAAMRPSHHSQEKLPQRRKPPAKDERPINI